MFAAERIEVGGEAVSSRAAAALDLHKGISDPRADFVVARAEEPREFPDPLVGGCRRWPDHMRLLNELTGELFPGRCRATNLCTYCRALYVVETVEMLTLDALEYPPELWLVLTAREHLTRRDTYEHLAQLRKSHKRRWPEIEWFVQVEFQRRGALHLNLLVKGVPADDDAELLDRTCARWCARVDAEPVGQAVRRVNYAEGLVRYLQKTLSHGLKQEQAPPIGWRGHRTSQTRGYLVRPASAMRQEAKAALRHKRELRRQLLAGLEGHDAELATHEALAAAAAATWRVVEIKPRRPLTERERDRAAGVPEPIRQHLAQASVGHDRAQGPQPVAASSSARLASTEPTCPVAGPGQGPRPLTGDASSHHAEGHPFERPPPPTGAVRRLAGPQRGEEDDHGQGRGSAVVAEEVRKPAPRFKSGRPDGFK
jgi:hypothetical protein